MDLAPNAQFENEIARVNQSTQGLLDDYVAWGDRIKHGETYFASYGDAIDFVNFRMETVSSCLALIEQGRIGDALGLCRSLMENYMLLMLICRGAKYFRLNDLSSKTPDEFKDIFNKQIEAWKAECDAGTTNCVEVSKYPRAARHIMYVYDGLKSQDGTDFPVSTYFFQFENFRPETMRLKPEDYFDYYEPPTDLKAALKSHRAEATSQYRYFLSYDALIHSLKLNGLLDAQAELRLEAHYTFLGRYLHPTAGAVRDLHQRSNWHSGKPAIGMDGTYSQSARLLASVYVCYLVAGCLDEIASLLDRGVALGYVKTSGTEALHAAVDAVPASIPYFWFLFNEATPYDRFNWAVHHATDEQLSDFGGYANLPSALVPFNQHIFANFKSGLGGWSNQRVGSYQAPFLK